MDHTRITNMLEELFIGIPETENVREQKEELRVHLTEQVNDYMAKGFTFEDAFRRAKDDMGDLDELVAEFSREISSFDTTVEEFVNQKKKDQIMKQQKKIKKLQNLSKRRRYTQKYSGLSKLIALSPFIYILMGVLIPGWRVWAFGWMIIPVSGILFEGSKHTSRRRIIISLTPFIYILLGMFFGWPFWLWGWIIIPVTAIILEMAPIITISTDIDLDNTRDTSDESNPLGTDAPNESVETSAKDAMGNNN